MPFLAGLRASLAGQGKPVSTGKANKTRQKGTTPHSSKSIIDDAVQKFKQALERLVEDQTKAALPAVDPAKQSKKSVKPKASSKSVILPNRSHLLEHDTAAIPYLVQSSLQPLGTDKAIKNFIVPSRDSDLPGAFEDDFIDFDFEASDDKGTQVMKKRHVPSEDSGDEEEGDDEEEDYEEEEGDDEEGDEGKSVIPSETSKEENQAKKKRRVAQRKKSDEEDSEDEEEEEEEEEGEDKEVEGDGKSKSATPTDVNIVEKTQPQTEKAGTPSKASNDEEDSEDEEEEGRRKSAVASEASKLKETPAQTHKAGTASVNIIDDEEEESEGEGDKENKAKMPKHVTADNKTKRKEQPSVSSSVPALENNNLLNIIVQERSLFSFDETDLLELEKIYEICTEKKKKTIIPVRATRGTPPVVAVSFEDEYINYGYTCRISYDAFLRFQPNVWFNSEVCHLIYSTYLYTQLPS